MPCYPADGRAVRPATHGPPDGPARRPTISRKVAIATLALPVVVLIYAREIALRGGRRLVAALAGLGALVAVLVVVLLGGLVTPRPATAIPGSGPRTIDPSEFRTDIRTGTAPSDPVTLSFPAPMDQASVARSVRVVPSTAVVLAWDATGAVLTIRPVTAWSPATYHTITVAAGVLDAAGEPSIRALRAAFLTRPAVTAALSATTATAAAPTPGATAGPTTRIRLAFDGPVRAATIGVSIEPAVAGSLTWDPTATDASPAWYFVPEAQLAPGATYVLTLAPGALDADGAPIAATPFELRTAAVPTVVRFRPRDGWTDVSRTQTLSVRFTEAMDRASTEAAWSAKVGETTLAGTFAWAEGDTVLVFTPSAAFGYGQTVVMAVGASARSVAGLPLAAPASATFTTVQQASSGTGSGSGGAGSGSGGGSVGSGTWGAVEGYYLRLLNCTRTGGWVTSSGECSSPGGGSVAPIILHSGISDRVARPYAKLLATKGICSHSADGTARSRMERAGFDGDFRENLGCRSGDPYSAVLGSHLYFQSEKPCSGYCHYNNIMDPKMRYVGIGVWVYAGRVRLVCDFWEG